MTRPVLRQGGYSILRRAGVSDKETFQSLQLLNYAVSRGLTVGYIRNPR